MFSAEGLSAVSVLISFASLFLVLLQVQQTTNQRKLESLIKIFDINHQLLALGFDRPELFEILQDTPEADPAWERHYLQLWLNQIAVVHFVHAHGLLAPDLSESLQIDIADFMKMRNMQRHWRRYRGFYSKSFQEFVDEHLPLP